MESLIGGIARIVKSFHVLLKKREKSKSVHTLFFAAFTLYSDSNGLFASGGLTGCTRQLGRSIVQELCESRGGRPGLSVLTSLLVSVDVKIYYTVLRHWSQLVPNMSTDI